MAPVSAHGEEECRTNRVIGHFLSRVGMDGMVPDWRGEVPRRLMAKDLVDGSTHVISAGLIWALLGILYVDVRRIMFFFFFFGIYAYWIFDL